jgi:hypothetical protein
VPKRLTLLTIVLVGVALAFAGLIAREVMSVPRVSAARPQPAASIPAQPAATAPPAAPAPPLGPAAYTVVATRNLFSPTRSEAPVTPPAPVAAAPVLPKPNLYGVVLQDGAPIAYLEDPVTKRVARYRVGDSVAGGTVKAIESDTVTLTRPEGPVAVRLHDPSRPRPAAPTGPTVQTPTPAPTPGTPAAVPPQAIGTGVQPSVPSRRALPPGVLGRTPPQPAQPADAPTPR